MINVSYFQEDNLEPLETFSPDLFDQVTRVLRQIYDPEIPVNIYDLGLFYALEIDPDQNLYVTMTLTSPGCPASENIMYEIEHGLKSIKTLKTATINLVFVPQWHKDMMSKKAKLALNLF